MITVLKIVALVVALPLLCFGGLLGIQFITYLLFRHHFGDEGDAMFEKYSDALNRGLNGDEP